MTLGRRMSALALVVTVSTLGIPVPAHAADDESTVVSGDRTLTFHGQPLWELLNAPPGGLSIASFVEQAEGQISGVLLNRDGQPLADQPVALSRPERGLHGSVSRESSSGTGQLSPSMARS